MSSAYRNTIFLEELKAGFAFAILLVFGELLVGRADDGNTLVVEGSLFAECGAVWAPANLGERIADEVAFADG